MVLHRAVLVLTNRIHLDAKRGREKRRCESEIPSLPLPPCNATAASKNRSKSVPSLSPHTHTELISPPPAVLSPNYQYSMHLSMHSQIHQSVRVQYSKIPAGGEIKGGRRGKSITPSVVRGFFSRQGGNGGICSGVPVPNSRRKRGRKTLQ